MFISTFFKTMAFLDVKFFSFLLSLCVFAETTAGPSGLPTAPLALCAFFASFFIDGRQLSPFFDIYKNKKKFVFDSVCISYGCG